MVQKFIKHKKCLNNPKSTIKQIITRLQKNLRKNPIIQQSPTHKMLRQKDRSQVYKVAVNAALGSFLFGYQLVNIGSLQLLFQNKNNLTPQQTRAMLSIITASLPLAAILGSAMLTTLVKNFKGRYLMIYMDVLAIIGMLIQDIGLSLWPLLIGRMIEGFVVGINSGLVAQYTFSVTPTTLSGSVGALRQVFLNVGVAMGYALGFLIDPEDVNDSINWRILISFPIITCVVRAVLLLTVLPYQIPLQRTKSKKIQRMEKYYYKIYENYALGTAELPGSNPSTLQPDLKPVNLDQSFTNSSQSQRKNLIICIILAGSNQFCGINAIIFYAKQLFMRITNNNNSQSQLIIIFLGIVQIIATFIGGRLMDKLPKRYFLFVGQTCMVFILLFIYIFNQNLPLVVILIFMHTIAYSFSIGQLLLFYAAKMLDSTGYVVMANWFATFLVAISAEFMMKILGIGTMCLVFCVLLTICLLVLGNKLPTDQQLLQRQMSTLTRPLDNTKTSQKPTTILPQQITTTIQTQMVSTTTENPKTKLTEQSPSAKQIEYGEMDNMEERNLEMGVIGDNSPNRFQAKGYL